MGIYADKLAKMCQNEAGESQYFEWLKNPVTQLFLGAFRERGRPAKSSMITTDAAFMLLGESFGWNGAADLMESPRAVKLQASVEPEASYGAGPVPEK